MGLADRLWDRENLPARQTDFFNDVKQVVSDLIQLNPNCKIILFGSVARDEANSLSDLDFAVYLADEIDRKVFQKDFYQTRTRIAKPVDLIFKKMSEFETCSEHPIDQQILQDGIEVYPTWKLNGNSSNSKV